MRSVFVFKQSYAARSLGTFAAVVLNDSPYSSSSPVFISFFSNGANELSSFRTHALVKHLSSAFRAFLLSQPSLHFIATSWAAQQHPNDPASLCTANILRVPGRYADVVDHACSMCEIESCSNEAIPKFQALSTHITWSPLYFHGPSVFFASNII